MTKSRRPAHAAVAASLLLLMTACASGNVVASSPTPTRPAATTAESAPSIPTPTPTPDLTALVVSSTGLLLLDDSGAPTAEFSFEAEDPRTFVDELSVSLGTDPEESTTPGGFEGAEFTTDYEWDGLVITTYYSPTQCDPECRGSFAMVTTPVLSGIPIRTVSGISVGDSVEAAQSKGAQATPEIPLASDPEDPALFGSSVESTRIVILDLDSLATTIVSLRASGWFSTFGNI